MKHLNLSFAASGFLGIYHLGAASALCRHGKKLLKVVKAFAGASSGALTATVLLTVPESIEALLASSFIPLYAGINAVDYKGQKWIDGGLTNGLPILPKGRTVTVSPFCGRLDICPENRGQVDIYAKVAKQDIMLSIGNLIRLHQALFPPSQEKMESLYQDGYDDTIQFLLKENWFE
ncbi:Patatin-like phospholipase domain-containing protein 4, partial [Ophiophagus hannah]